MRCESIMRYILALFSLLAILLVVSCNSVQEESEPLAELRFYRSLSEWLNSKHLDFIVIGQVISRGEGRIIPRSEISPDVQKRIEQAGGLNGTIVTDYSFKIERVIKGNGSAAGETITIVQSGGSVDGRTVNFVPMFRPIQVGERAILSLVYDERDPTVSESNKKYTVVMNPEVRYRIVNGRIELMPGDWHQIPTVREFQSLRAISESEFINKAERLVIK